MIANLAHTARETLTSVPPFNTVLSDLDELETKRGMRPEEVELCFFYAGGARAKKDHMLGILRRIREAGVKSYRLSLLGEPDLAIPIVECVPTRYDRQSPTELEPELQRELCCGGLTGKRVGVVRREHVNSSFQGWVEERFAESDVLTASGIVAEVVADNVSLVRPFNWPPPLSWHGLVQTWLVFSCAPDDWVGHTQDLPERLAGWGSLVRAVWELSHKPWEEVVAMVTDFVQIGKNKAHFNYFSKLMGGERTWLDKGAMAAWRQIFMIAVTRGLISPPERSGNKRKADEYTNRTVPRPLRLIKRQKA